MRKVVWSDGDVSIREYDIVQVYVAGGNEHDGWVDYATVRTRADAIQGVKLTLEGKRSAFNPAARGEDFRVVEMGTGRVLIERHA